MNADWAATRMSQASAIAKPAPAAAPGSAAIVGLRTATSAPVSSRWRSLRSAMRCSAVQSFLALLSPMPLTSPPAQKAVPAPVISSAPTRGSSPRSLIMRRSAGVSWSDSALRASGRLSVMMATPSRIAHSSWSVPVSMVTSAAGLAGSSRL